MESILNQIIDAKKTEIEAKTALGLYRLAEKNAEENPRHTRSLRQALLNSDTGIIAEFKRHSPSKKEIHTYADPSEIIPEYERVGATGCSVLTDTIFFGGSLSDLATARNCCSLPLLRKDFIIDSRQIFEAYLFGADAILLIASALTTPQIRELTRTAHRLGLEVLFEIHGEDELDKIIPEVDIVGVNNRNLANFETGIEASARIAESLPKGMVKISESGISSADDVKKLRGVGFNGFLIGEMFMKHKYPFVALEMLIKQLEGFKLNI